MFATRKLSSSFLNFSKANMSCTTIPKFETLSVTIPKEYVYHVELNRPDKLNAFNNTMWLEIAKCFESINDDENCRVVVMSAAGKHFTSGIDLQDIMNMAPKIAAQDDTARKAKILHELIVKYQKPVTSLELCRKPVIAAVHSACVGGGVDLITAADMRYCTADAWFQVKEVDLGLAADVGTLQRLPKVIGSDGLARELCYTARKMLSAEALSCGLVSRVYDTKESMITETLKLAELIAKKSPVAVQGTKKTIVFSRDHTVQEGLDYIALYNQMALQSEDFVNSATAQATKTEMIFSKL